MGKSISHKCPALQDFETEDEVGHTVQDVGFPVLFEAHFSRLKECNHQCDGVVCYSTV